MQQETKEQDFARRIIAALGDLAHFSLQTSSLRFATPETIHHLATAFIAQLVSLCEARQGALLLTQPVEEFLTPRFQQFSPDQLNGSLVAGAHMDVEEARIALASYASTLTSPDQPVAGFKEIPSMLVWRRLLTVSPSLPGETEPRPGFHSYAFLLFRWPVDSQQAQEGQRNKQEQAEKLLPFLADLVDAILLHLLVASREAAQSNELFPTELLATVGHEFRGPLTTIQGYATTLLRHDQQLAADERQDFLKAISEASAHIGKLVDRFLELAQFESHTHLFVPVSVDLAALAQEAITAARKNGSHLHLMASPQMNGRISERREEHVTGNASCQELIVFGDRRLLRTMLDLLLENALTYSPQDGLIEVIIHPGDLTQLPLTFNPDSASGRHVAVILPAAFQGNEPLVEIQVRDHGIGISPADLSRIFHRFYRVDTSLTREGNGLGLGLALCKSIVTQHQGMLWVESALGEGSTFHIVLPCSNVNDQ